MTYTKSQRMSLENMRRPTPAAVQLPRRLFTCRVQNTCSYI